MVWGKVLKFLPPRVWARVRVIFTNASMGKGTIVPYPWGTYCHPCSRVNGVRLLSPPPTLQICPLRFCFSPNKLPAGKDSLTFKVVEI